MADETMPENPAVQKMAQFFASVMNFLQKNVPREDIAVMVLIETADGQFWVQGSVNSTVWTNGMIATAERYMQAQTQVHVQEDMQKIKQAIAEQELRAIPIDGRTQ